MHLSYFTVLKDGYVNKVTLSTFFSLATSALIPIFILKVGANEILITYNYYFVAVSLAIIIDAFSLLRTERILSRRKHRRKLTEKIISNFFWFGLVIGPISLLEIIFLNTPFLIVMFTRAVLNFSRVALVHYKTLSLLGWFVNFLASIRNLIWLVFIYLELQALSFSQIIWLTTFVELLLIFTCLVMMVGLKKLNKVTPFDFGFLKVIVNSIRKVPTWMSFSNGYLSLSDRVAISLLPEAVQVKYIGYKFLNQYVDSFFAVIAYRIRLLTFANKRVVSKPLIIFPCIISLVFVFVFTELFFEIEHAKSYLIFGSIGFFLTARRAIDVFVSPFLMSQNRYDIIFKRNTVETILIICALLFLLDYDADFIYLVVSSLSFLTTAAVFYLYKLSS